MDEHLLHALFRLLPLAALMFPLQSSRSQHGAVPRDQITVLINDCNLHD
ncbi:MAG: hypothetical protein OXP69_00230 [Spirochaetaceae bacterium]|nr:hypothetical protein [Spirochaetaceae bacterium]